MTTTDRALPDDIPGVLSRLDEIIDWAIEHHSPIGYFAAVYRSVTQTIHDEIMKGPSPAGAFVDPERMRRFDVVFANRFIAAFDDWQAGRTPTEAWRLAFETAEAERLATTKRSRWGRLPVLVHLLLGVNAHMNLDLGCAASEIAPGEAFPELRGDFQAINHVLAGMVPRERMAEERVAPFERLADRWHWLSGHIIDADIEARRESSWRYGESIARLVAEARHHAIGTRDGTVVGQGHTLLAFVQDRFWASPRHIFIRPLVLIDAWTTDPVADVIRAFAGDRPAPAR